ncbi:hypothetical protein [uncultured Mucilaginibacter sp.]|uniref:hypothetical protein n=1 Tax=uncultured Mucilaginibacter sp. TaxID=797541 RepID=UPI0026199238|nr:hypothetical protein [uncultured Mucilaginibacter sp.]
MLTICSGYHKLEAESDRRFGYVHPNSPGYRLILNNVLFPAAKKKSRRLDAMLFLSVENCYRYNYSRSLT